MGNYKDAGSLTLLTGQSRSAHSGDEPEPSILTRFAQEHPFGVILVDEIEKAHPEVLHLFLSILDDGTFRDRHGFVTSFSFTTIILTSNLGHHDKSGAVGFAKGGMSGKALATEQKTRALDVIRASLPREFIGRLDDVFIFNQLSPAVMAALIRRRVVRMGDVLGIGITLTPEQIDKVIQHTVATGLGARALDRLVEKLVGVPVARMKLRGEIRQGQEVRIELS
jgi:ATP-dependent Clp protease ATP-binding subunit ClpB